MRRAIQIGVLVAGVVLAGVGVALATGPVTVATAGFGWTAYSPLSSTAYRPFDAVSLLWWPRIGVGLVALGAGCAGGAIAALVLTARRGRGRPTR